MSRFTPHALPGQSWGDFTGKTITEVVRIITQLAPHALPGMRYGSFEGKALSDEPDLLHVFRPTYRPRRR